MRISKQRCADHPKVTLTRYLILISYDYLAGLYYIAAYPRDMKFCWVKSSSQVTQFTQSSKHFRQDKVVCKVVFIS